MGRFVNLDEEATVFFQRELESRKSQTYDIVRAPLKAFELIPVDSTAGAGAESIAYEQYDITGIAKIISNYADDLPRADVKGKEFTSRIKSIGNSYGYSLQDIRAAQFAGKPLEQRKSNAAVRAQRELWNRIAFKGDVASGLPGWLTNPNLPSASVTNDGTGAATTFVSKVGTPDKILRDMNDLCNGIPTLTNGVEIPNTLVMPLAQHSLISTTRMAAGTDTTILEYFLKNSPFIKSVEWAVEMKAAIGGLDVMIAYDRNPDKFTFEMPQPFEQLPAQERGLEYVVPCHSRVAGTLIYYPLSMSIGKGI